MARKKAKAGAQFVLFDVVYEDGILSSNRRVPTSALGALEGDAPIEAQDCEIAERSGRPRSPIKSINRVGQRKAPYERPGKPAAQAPKARH